MSPVRLHCAVPEKFRALLGRGAESLALGLMRRLIF